MVTFGQVPNAVGTGKHYIYERRKPVTVTPGR